MANHEVTITSLNHEGWGVSKINGKTIFLHNALPHEKVTFYYKQKRRNFAKGIADTILNPSSHRVTPPCQHYALCGGCSLQHLHSEQQILHKQHVLLEQLQHFGAVIPQQVLPPLTQNPWGYRHKARLGVRYIPGKHKVLVGFRERNGRYIADLNRCEVLHPAIANHINQLSELIGQLSIYQHIPQLEIAIGDEQVAIIMRHLTPFSETDLKLLQQFAQQHTWHMYLQPKGMDSIHRLWPTQGEERLIYTLPDQQIAIGFHPADFTQVNLSINRLLVNQAIQLLELKKSDNVLDLFCGIGNFTLPLAQHCQSVTGIEVIDTMVKRGYENAKRNHIANVEFQQADLQSPLKTTRWNNQAYDKILLDPPRSGALELVQNINHWAAKRIVYVSCNPATLARDSKILTQQHGYQLVAAGVIDMFPHTSHVESIAVFNS